MSEPVEPATRHASRPVRRWAYLLLLAPFVGTLWVSTYAAQKPRLFGFPFFYWYQFAWVVAGSAITALVYLVTTPRRRGQAPPGGRRGDVYPASPAPTDERSRTR